MKIADMKVTELINEVGSGTHAPGGGAEAGGGRVCVQLAMPDFKYMSGETLTLEGGMGQRP